MDGLLTEVLEDLRRASFALTAAAGAENMHTVVLRRGCDPQDVVAFLERAADICLGRMRASKAPTATFYAWYDDMAGQLRFSVVPTTPEVLPFGARIELAESSAAIAKEALSTWTPGIIPARELSGCEWEPPNHGATSIKVWVRGYRDAV